MLGQIKVEFVFAMVIFSIIVFFIATQTNNIFTSILTDSRNDVAKAKGINLLDYLITDRGDPTNWESGGTTNRIGLASSPYSLSITKILALNNSCDKLSIFELDGYRLKAYNTTHLLLFCGFRSLETPIASVVRYVKIENDQGNISVELY